MASLHSGEKGPPSSYSGNVAVVTAGRAVRVSTSRLLVFGSPFMDAEGRGGRGAVPSFVIDLPFGPEREECSISAPGLSRGIILGKNC
jgi:hypothetical protein